MPIDTIRHQKLFSPTEFAPRRVDIIGAGATGSRIALGVAKLGVENIHVWDFDTVAKHNIANQIYGDSDVGVLKVKALASIILATIGLKIEVHAEKVDGTQQLGDVVFVLTDTMESRKAIWEKGLKFKLRTKLVIETRMGTDNARIYTVNPNKLAHVKGWEQTLYTSAESEVSACGTKTSVGPTAEIISGLAVWQMMRWFAIEQGAEDTLENELLVFLRPTAIMSRNF